jgi:hypothetical protein
MVGLYKQQVSAPSKAERGCVRDFVHVGSMTRLVHPRARQVASTFPALPSGFALHGPGFGLGRCCSGLFVCWLKESKGKQGRKFTLFQSLESPSNRQRPFVSTHRIPLKLSSLRRRLDISLQHPRLHTHEPSARVYQHFTSRSSCLHVFVSSRITEQNSLAWIVSDLLTYAFDDLLTARTTDKGHSARLDRFLTPPVAVA